MRGLGKGIREFNSAKENVKKELEEGMQEKDQVKPAATANPAVNTTTVAPETKTTSEEPVAAKP
jgi:sec-independent protein translocase protein TatA